MTESVSPGSLSISTRQGHLDTDIESDENLTRLERHDVMEPGCYWRAKDKVTVTEHAYGRIYNHVLQEGDIHLLLNVFVHEGINHSVELLCHPRRGNREVYTLLMPHFLENFEPVSEQDALAIREAEQAKIMAQVEDVQNEMAQAEVNPLALPEVQEAAEEAVEKFEREQIAKAQVEAKNAAARDQDIRKIHRRAARRSEAKGNPIALRRATISDNVEVMISEGITSDGVRELALEAGRRIAIAEAASKWIAKRADHMASLIKERMPYFAERHQVAIAKSKGAIEMVKSLSEGIESLKLYTGDGVTTVTVKEGSQADTRHPLVLIQGKRFMDQELATWSQVEDSFDYSSQSRFFAELATNKEMLDQVLPLPRCVVSMAVTARQVQYSKDTHWYEVMMKEIQNRRVFLLVRNGDNVYAVYSEEPSHEAAHRLFPTRNDIEAPFVGVDGTKIGLQDIRFSKSVEDFEVNALTYKRFLILLCGLDHREKLFGEFYPPEAGLKFMSLEFQSQYFRFLEDDAQERMLDSSDVVPVKEWIANCNNAVRSGSRIVVSTGDSMIAVTKAVSLRKALKLDRNLPRHFTASVSKGFHKVEIPYRTEDLDLVQATAWLDGPQSKELGTWYLCIDKVRLSDVNRYLYSRRHKTSDLSWIRTLRQVRDTLMQDFDDEKDLRSYLRETALTAKVLTEDTVDEAINQSIITWRADRKGATAPTVDQITQVNEILTLMYPAGSLAETMHGVATALAESLGQVPLRLVRTGKARYALYTAVPEEERAAYGTGVVWGWIKRHSIAQKKGRLEVTASALAWIERNAQSAAEEVVIDWPGMDAWRHDGEEPVSPAHLLSYRKDLQEAAREQFTSMLANGRAAPSATAIDDELMDEILHRTSKHRRSSTYYTEGLRISLPVGVYQKKPGSKPVFCYAIAMVSTFVARYGTKDQIAAFLEVFSRSHAAREEMENGIQWNLRGFTRPIPEAICTYSDNAKIVLPSESMKWLVLEKTHKPGGITVKARRYGFFRSKTTRAERRAEGGAPWHESTSAALSFNRALDTLMGHSTKLRAQFYKDREGRMFFASTGFGDDREEKRQKERERKFDLPAPVAHELSPLIWDAKQGRGVGNRYFSMGSKPVQAKRYRIG
jgi:hypothetical protein